MKRLLIVTLLPVALVCCKKVNLNGFAFPAVKLDEYLFEEYNGEIDLPEDFQIDPSQRTLVTMESMDASTGNTLTIYGVYIGDTSTIANDTVILYLHGQSRHMDHYWSRAALLANAGGKHNYGVFMIDYRGYGMSEGESTEQSLYEDANAAIDWLRDRGVSDNRLVYYGYSLGAIPCIDRAAFLEGFEVDKLIIEAPLASVEYLVHSSTLINFSPGFVTTLDFPNAEKIKSYPGELMWLHGREDDYIAIENGELIYANHEGVAKFPYRIDGGRHGDIPEKMGWENYLNAVVNFIRN